MKKLAVIVLLFIALKYGGAAALTIVYLAAAWWGFFWLLRKIGILSAPRRMSKSAGQAFYSGMMNWLNREPTQAEIERERERAQAKKDYAFHSYQAERYKGTRNGAWHEDMARRARNKMR